MARAKTKSAEVVVEAAAQPAPVISAVKGFNADLQCAPNCKVFQFEIGKTYSVAGKIKACSNGFHAVDWNNPFHVWDFYPVIGNDGRLTRYAEVVLSGATDRDEDENKRGTKIAAAEITIKAELSLPDFIRRAVDAVVDLTRGKGDDASGDSARIGSSGHNARIGSSGYNARIGSSGYNARIGSSGNYAQIGSSGNYAQIVAEGKDAVIACAGSAIVMAGPGGAICIPYSDGTRTRFAIGYVGEDGIEAGVAYRAEAGKLVKAVA